MDQEEFVKCVKEFSCCSVVSMNSRVMQDLLMDTSDVLEFEQHLRNKLPTVSFPKNAILVKDLYHGIKNVQPSRI